MKSVRFLLFVFLFSLFAPISFSQETVPEASPEEPSRYDNYIEGATNKFDRGAINLLMGWTEILSEPLDHAREREGKMAKTGHFFIGIGEGLINGVLNTVGGTANLVTSLIPAFEIPLPEGGIDVQKIAG